jgi:hypothetical protein
VVVVVPNTDGNGNNTEPGDAAPVAAITAQATTTTPVTASSTTSTTAAAPLTVSAPSVSQAVTVAAVVSANVTLASALSLSAGQTVKLVSATVYELHGVRVAGARFAKALKTRQKVNIVGTRTGGKLVAKTVSIP